MMSKFGIRAVSILIPKFKSDFVSCSYMSDGCETKSSLNVTNRMLNPSHFVQKSETAAGSISGDKKSGRLSTAAFSVALSSPSQARFLICETSSTLACQSSSSLETISSPLAKSSSGGGSWPFQNSKTRQSNSAAATLIFVIHSCRSE